MDKEKNTGFKEWFGNLDWLRKVGVIAIAYLIIAGGGGNTVTFLKAFTGVDLKAKDTEEYVTKDKLKDEKKTDSLILVIQFKDLKEDIKKDTDARFDAVERKLDRIIRRDKKNNSKDPDEDLIGDNK